MITVQSFVFNPFQENTFVLYDETKECVVIDPGCFENEEKQQLCDFIESNGLKPMRLLNTHCHIDHVIGNLFVAGTYQIGLEIHEKDLPILDALQSTAQGYGFHNMEQSPEPTGFLEEGMAVEFGNSKLDVLHVPGHSPGHVVFVDNTQKFIIAGDVLFYGSIGRTDLPGGDHDTLIEGIRQKLFTLGDDYQVYCGHGPATNIGFEKTNNPFLS